MAPTQESEGDTRTDVESETADGDSGWETVAGLVGVLIEREHDSLFADASGAGHPSVRVRAKRVGVDGNYRVEMELSGGDRRKRLSEVLTTDDPDRARGWVNRIESVLGGIPDGWQVFKTQRAAFVISQTDGNGRVEVRNRSVRFSTETEFLVAYYSRETHHLGSTQNVGREQIKDAVDDAIESVEEVTA